MAYLWTTLKVKNLEESIEFYQDIVGLKIQRRFKAGPKSEIAFLAAGKNKTEVELIEEKEIEKIDIGKDISLGFEVDSVKGKMDFLKERGIEIYEGPISPNPDVEFFFILDPNGVKIQFVENK